MTWQYCKKCDAGMDEPTLEEIGNQNRECPQCGADNHPLKSLGEVLVKLSERIKALEDDL
jgi:uncharacterized paraquat-inducible protein A